MNNSEEKAYRTVAAVMWVVFLLCTIWSACHGHYIAAPFLAYFCGVFGCESRAR